MTMTVRQTLPCVAQASAFREAMRRLAGGVSVITAGAGDERTGLTVTSAISLSMDPPSMMVCINRAASAWPIIERERRYCVNILDARHQHVAHRFAARGVKGRDRYDGARWRRFDTGVSGLEDALAIIECAVEEIIERHTHGIVIGAVQAAHLGGGGEALLYAYGRYRALPLV